MKNHKTNFRQWNKDIFIQSVKKINFNIIWMIILDGLFYLIAGYIASSWFQSVQLKGRAYLQDIESLGYTEAHQLSNQAQPFFFWIISSFVIIIILIILLESIFKGIIWMRMSGKKINIKLLSKFFLVNIIWAGFWLLALFAATRIVDDQNIVSFAAGILIAAFYLTNALYTMFMESQSFRSIPESIKLSISNFHIFLLPYICFFIGLISIGWIFGLAASAYSGTISSVVLFIYATALLAYSAFARYYFSTLVLEIIKSK